MVTTFSWRQPRSWSLLLLCLLLTGCATRVIYYWLDSAIVWQLDDYFSLDRSQKKLLDQEVKGLMAWHRQHELPIYARDLDALAKAVALSLIHISRAPWICCVRVAPSTCAARPRALPSFPPPRWIKSR